MSKLAILGGPPLRTKPWPTWPIVGAEEETQLMDTLRSGQWWYGKKVRQFEEEFAAFQDARFGVTCCNGTTAIEISLVAAGIGAGDEVITTPFTFMATASAILKANAIPVFADIDEATANLDPGAAEKLINPRTKAIMPVHVAGRAVDIDRFDEIGRKHNIKIIYDAAHGWGSQWKGTGLGNFGAFNTYSFQASKNITAGEGGMILTNDETLADTARSLTNCGRSTKGAWYEHFLLGSNNRMTELQAAILLAQLTRLEAQTLTRMKNAAYLEGKLAQVGIGTPPNDGRVTRQSYHLHCLRYDARAFDGLPRGTFIKAVAAEGIAINAVWPLLYKMPLFRTYTRTGAKGCPVSCPYHQADPPDYNSLHLPAAERLSYETGFWLPHRVLLTEQSDMDEIVSAIAKVRDNAKELLSAKS